MLQMLCLTISFGYNPSRFSMEEELQKFDDLTEEQELDPKPSRKRQIIIAAICVIIVVLLAVSLALIVKTYVITTFTVDGISMWPTLDGGSGAYMDSDNKNGETLYLNKVAKVKRGDIVVFSPEWDSMRQADGSYKALVKRVIAVGGDHIQIIDAKVYLNGELLNEPYINEEMSHDYDGLDVIIEKGNIFCMGDNRNHSSDCRTFGQIPVSRVIGKCFLIKGLDGKLRKQ